jgi:hypothetical protein
MNIYSVEFTLTMIALGTVGLSISIYIGSRLLRTLNTKATPVALHLSDRRSGIISPAARRRSEVKPGIICSLPIHQQGPRHEAIPSMFREQKS